MIGVGRNALETVQQKLHGGTHILVRGKGCNGGDMPRQHGIHIGRNRTARLLRQLLRMQQSSGLQGSQGLGIKIDVCQGAEQGLSRKIIHGYVHNAFGPGLKRNMCQLSQLRHQSILNIGNLGLLAANTDFFAPLALIGLFALIQNMAYPPKL